MPTKIKIKLEKIERAYSETLTYLAILLATKFPQLRKISWKEATKKGKTISLIPIIPEPMPTQAESIERAKPRKIASLASILLEWSIS